jgi:hypothetical protein
MYTFIGAQVCESSGLCQVTVTFRNSPQPILQSKGGIDEIASKFKVIGAGLAFELAPRKV